MNYINQYDEESGYTFEIPEIELPADVELEEALLHRSAEIHAALLSALYNGITLNLDQVPVFAVKGADSVVGLPREDFGDRLETSLSYFQALEEYEICSTLTALREQL